MDCVPHIPCGVYFFGETFQAVGMHSGILLMHKKTVIPAASLFFSASMLSFIYPQSSKKAYQGPFHQK